MLMVPMVASETDRPSSIVLGSILPSREAEGQDQVEARVPASLGVQAEAWLPPARSPPRTPSLAREPPEQALVRAVTPPSGEVLREPPAAPVGWWEATRCSVDQAAVVAVVEVTAKVQGETVEDSRPVMRPTFKLLTVRGTDVQARLSERTEATAETLRPGPSREKVVPVAAVRSTRQ